jgi:hypothetical protein
VSSSLTGPSNKNDLHPCRSFLLARSMRLEFTTRQKGVVGENCQRQFARPERDGARHAERNFQQKIIFGRVSLGPPRKKLPSLGAFYVVELRAQTRDANFLKENSHVVSSVIQPVRRSLLRARVQMCIVSFILSLSKDLALQIVCIYL